MEYVYVALIKDPTDFDIQILTVQSTKEKIKEYIDDYFGIGTSKTNPVYLGYIPDDSEHPDDYMGYHKIEDETYTDERGIYKIYLYCKYIDEKCN